jgi:hypothetical protein
VYWANTQPPRQWYIRYDIATGKREIEMEQIFGQQLTGSPNDSGSFVANRREKGSRQYFVSTIDDRSRLACLASDDNGQTWLPYATSDQTFPARVYSISAAREPTAAGEIVGTFTIVKGAPKTYQDDNSGSVYFFRIPTAMPSSGADAVDNVGAKQ